jgi:Mg-chelatase subunit ChlD
VNIFRWHKSRSRSRGQILPMFAIFLIIMLLFVALAIDLGYAYVTKANISKAVDAAALKGALALSQGQATATTVAQNVFAANYGTNGRDFKTPAPSVTYTTDAFGNTLINVSATTTISTFFARIMPGMQTMNVSGSSQATRAKLVMSTVLDRSGSMGTDGGMTALQTAVPSFVDYFDNVNDHVALVSFGSNVTTNVAMTTGFQAPIKTAVAKLSANGATFALGGMQQAQIQNNSVVIPAGQNIGKVIVFFTDGFANTLGSDNLTCAGYPLVNYGGNAPSEGNTIWFMDPVTGNTLPAGGGQCTITSGGQPACCTAKNFVAQQPGNNGKYTTANITNESEYRMLQLAQKLWTATPPDVPTTIYTIGLGNDIDAAFMKQLANDPSSSTYNSSLPSGLYFGVSNCPSTTCTNDLQQAFQTIAAQILLRLTQ